MSRPTVSDSAERLYETLTAYAADDETNGWVLLHACEAAARMLANTNAVLRHDDIGSGLRRLHDPDRTPTFALAWLAQHAGVPEIGADLTEAQARQLIRDAPGMRRGTPAALRSAAQRYLTGNKTVIMLERNGGAYQLAIVTRTDETPDAGKVLAALLTQKPAGIILTYTAADSQVWDEVTTAWDDVDPGVTWNDTATTAI